MNYADIYDKFQPIMDWLKEHYPHDMTIEVDTNSARLVEKRGILAMDKHVDDLFKKQGTEVDGENQHAL